MNEDSLLEKYFKSDDLLNFDFNPDEQRKLECTYIFKYYDKERTYYYPFVSWYMTTEEEIEINKKVLPELIEKQLYWMPENPPYDFYIRYYNWQLDLLTNFFSNVFEERAHQQGFQPSHIYYNIILPESKYNEIMKCINHNELLTIRDLLFEVISIAQHYYVEHIAFWEQPKMQKLVSSAEKETKKVISLLDKFYKKDPYQYTSKSKPETELLHINFVFNDETIKIEHNWLAEDFIKHFKNHYDNLPHKNWRLDLARYPEGFEDNYRKQQFKYNLAQSLYNLFTEVEFFPVTKAKPTPNNLMLCIAKILEFCLIPVAGEGELDAIKVKNVRNWLQRYANKNETVLPEIVSDKVRLLKYFEPEFVNLTDKIEKLDAINIGCYIGKRFKIEKLIPDLIHLAQSLRQNHSLIGHQMFMKSYIKKETFNEFDTFKKLVKGVKGDQKVTSIKFKLEGDDKEYELQQRLPLYIIEEAIKEYSENQRVEVDTDLVRTKATRTAEGSFIIEKGEQFALPNERFMVRFVKAFYDYLLAEVPLGKKYYSYPSSRYYPIIAIMLQQTQFFYHTRDCEEFIIAKVEQWHKLSLTE
jgi:hypothetical protein